MQSPSLLAGLHLEWLTRDVLSTPVNVYKAPPYKDLRSRLPSNLTSQVERQDHFQGWLQVRGGRGAGGQIPEQGPALEHPRGKLPGSFFF